MHMITRSSVSSGNGVFGSTLTPRWAFMIESCFLTASVNGSTFSNASQETGRTLACPIDDPISSSPGVLAHHQGISSRRSPPGTPLPYLSKVAARPSGRRAPCLQTGSKLTEDGHQEIHVLETMLGLPGPHIMAGPGHWPGGPPSRR